MNTMFLTVFFPTIVFYGLSFFSPNNKIFILLFCVYAIVMYVLHIRWKDVLLYCYLAVLPLATGKKIPFDLVSFREFNLLAFRPYGISAEVIITLADACAILMAIVILKDYIVGAQRKKYRDPTAIGLLFFFLVTILSTVYGSLRPDISILHSLFFLKPLIIYWYITHHVQTSLMWKKSLYIFAASLWLVMIVSGVQLLKQGPIGSVLELTPDYIPYDTSSDSGQVFRPVGTFYHANTLANYVLPYVFIMLPFLFATISHVHSGICITSFVVGFFVLLLTLSRSAWISFFVGFVVYVMYIEKVWNMRLKFVKKAKNIVIWWLLPLCMVILAFVLPRIMNTSFTFDRYGSAETRVLLLRDAAEAAKENPIFGVGLEMDLFFMYVRSVRNRITNGVIFFFPEPVHNGYMRLLLQVGFVGSIGYAVAIIFLFREEKHLVDVAKGIPHKHIVAATIGGIVALAMNSMFQPLVLNIQDIVLYVLLNKAYYRSRDLIEGEA